MWLGIDLGTSAVKAQVFDPSGAVVGQGRGGYSVTAPTTDWSESDPEMWWSGVVQAVRTAVRGHEDAIQGIGLSGQMHGVVLADAKARPLRPAILWSDARSARQLEAFRDLTDDKRIELGNPIVSGMAGPSLLWLREFEPVAYEDAAWSLQPKDWLRFRLVGDAATDPSDASATLLYDVVRDAWHEDVVHALGLDRELLPPIRPSNAIAGSLEDEPADALGLRAGIPVATGAADTAAAILGSGLQAGDVQVTIGTGAQAVQLLAAPDPSVSHRGLHLYRAAEPGRWYRMAAIQNSGLALEWARSILGFSWERMLAALERVSVGADGLVFLPFLTGERTPHLSSEMRAGWHGASPRHTQDHFARAAFEGVAFALADAFDALVPDGAPRAPVRLAGGGSVSPAWRQILADALGVPLEPTREVDASVRGAAMLAASALDAPLAPAEVGTGEVVHPSEDVASLDAAREAFERTVRSLYGGDRL